MLGSMSIVAGDCDVFVIGFCCFFVIVIYVIREVKKLLTFKLSLLILWILLSV